VVPLKPTGNVRDRRLRLPFAYGDVVVFYSLLIVIWELASRLLKIPAFILPPPSSIGSRLLQDPAGLAGHLAVTGYEVLLGFVVGVVVSIPLAVVIVAVPAAERLIYPALVVFQAVPKVALAPLLVIWFGFGLSSKVMLAFVTAIFPMVINTVVGMKQTPPELVYLLRSLGASEAQVFFKVRLVGALPYMFAGLKVGITLAVVGAVVGEFIAANSGLGFLLLVANNRFDTTLVFGVLVVLSVVSVGLFYLVELIEALVLPGPLRRRAREVQARGG
jgi:NitT/TauT family transport system permease protein